MLKSKPNSLKAVFIFSVFVFCLSLSIIQPVNAAPDEYMKMDICKYIADHMRLPHGGDPIIRNEIWGNSYAFSPILPYIIGGLFIKIMRFFSSDVYHAYVAARFVSVICCTLMAWFNLKIGNKLFKNATYKWIFVIFITLLPQVLYLGAYINNDSFALLTIAMIVYSWILGLDSNWDRKSVVLLGVSIGLCALSYYNAYGYILTSFFVFLISFFINKDVKFDIKSFFKKGVLIFVIVFLIAGWWFIRSAILYDGDFLGLKTCSDYAQKFAIDQYKPSNISTPYSKGMSIFGMYIFNGFRCWLVFTALSFVGVFGYMNIYMHNLFYVVFFAVYLLGFIFFIKYILDNRKVLLKDKNSLLLKCVFVINIIIPFVLSSYYSYTSDYQPQGRYIMPMLLPLMYFIVTGLKCFSETKLIKKINYKQIFEKIIILSFSLLLPIYCFIKLFIHYRG